ncbi:MAG TPA: PAS domain-containing protein [Solirubrobacteraceae bacterium]|jgi:PAS domain S-box-containing protein|nr:PAS domain-containing protein [Solirubrobacteraceae bacterium]
MRRRARVGRRDAPHLLEALLNSVDLAVIACARDGRMTLANRQAHELIGFDCPEESDSEAWLARLLPRTPSGLPLALEDVPLIRALNGEAVEGVDMLVKTSDGDVLLSARARPVDDHRGRRRGAVAVLEDVTEQRVREAQARDRWRA